MFNRQDLTRVTLPLLMATPDSLEQAEVRYKYLKVRGGMGAWRIAA
jgi:hypothetical protein